MRAFVFCFLMVVGGVTFVYGQEVVSDTVNYDNIQLKSKLTPIHYRMDYLELPNYTLVEIAKIISNDINVIMATKSQYELIFDEIHSEISGKKYDKVVQSLKLHQHTLTNPSGFVSAEYYHDLALICKVFGEYDIALTMCGKAITMLEHQLPSNKGRVSWATMSGGRKSRYRYLANFYILKGQAYHLNGSYQSALETYGKALLIWSGKINGSYSQVAKTYIDMGNTYYALGDYEKADAYYNRNLEILKDRIGEEQLIAEAYNQKGNICYVLGDYERALEFYNKSLQEARGNITRRHPLKAQIYMSLSNVYHIKGEYEKAQQFQEKALRILEKKFGKYHPYTGQSYNQLGAILYSLKDYGKALQYQEDAMQILSKTLGNNHPHKAPVYNNLAITKFAFKQYDEAISFQELAIGIIEKRQGEDHPETIDYKLTLAKMYKRIGNYHSADSLWHIIVHEAIKHQNNSYLFLHDQQRLEYLNTVQNIYTNFYSFALMHGQEETIGLATDLLINTKSLVLDYGISFRKIMAQIDDEELTELAEELNKLNHRLIGAEMHNSVIFNNQRRVNSLRQQRDYITAKILRNKTLKARLNTQIKTWQTLQNQLNDDEAIIDFLLIDEGLKKSYCAILTRKSGTPLFISLTDESVITSILNNKDYIGELSLRKQLYKELWLPLEAHLENVKTVYLSPSGALHKIPFEALQNDKRQYLSEYFQFHYHSSMRDFAKSEPQQVTYKDAVLIGHILYDLKDSLDYQALSTRGDLRDKVTPLEGTLDEVNRIDTICQQVNLPTALLTINEPTEEVVQFLTGDNSPSIYHFATHGVFLNPTDTTDSESKLRSRLRLSSDPLKRSALMLYGANHTWVKGEKILGSKEDGILTALEVTALDLQNTDLVVLSACSTGLGDTHNTEGVFGLQRAFKLAGVNHVVASLWDVDDEATKDLMVKFYENLLKEKQDPATALRNAKDHFRTKGYEPQDWAGFILIE